LTSSARRSRRPKPTPKVGSVSVDAIRVAVRRAISPSLDVMCWGLVPFWAKDIRVGFANIYAKAEGIESKPTFREAFQRRRCLVPG
jgi:putative SOS response-associated peptidase YedK